MSIPRYIAVPLLILPWVLALAVLAWMVIQRFPPNSTFVASSALDGQSIFINPFLPAERANSPGVQSDGWVGQRITDDPVYFTARVPGPYKSAEVEIEYRPMRQPFLEFGRVFDLASQDLDISPMFSTELQTADWIAAAGGFVRTGTSASTLQTAKTNELALWRAKSVMPLSMDHGGVLREIKLSLRGAHDFYFIPVDGALDVTLGIQDSNRKQLKTTVVGIRVLRGSDEIKTQALQTSGRQDTKMGEVFFHRINLKDLEPGVYRLAFQADDDVFIRSIKTTSRHWVVGPRLNFGDTVGYSEAILSGRAWTNSRHLTLETLHAEGLQTVGLGSVKIAIARTHQIFRLDRTDDVPAPVELSVPLSDMRLVGDGWFAFSPGAFFEPYPKRLTDATDLKLEKIFAVITDFKLPEKLADGWWRSHFTYALNGTEDGLRFVLSAPGIADRAGAVDVRRISITYGREPLSLKQWLSLLRQEAANVWHRL
jgi:hypothetical protein